MFSRPAAGGVTVARAAAVDTKTEIQGAEGTLDYRRFFKDGAGKDISPWHSLPLYVNEEAGEVWMVTEIPKMTKPKMEIATKEPWNPIHQDRKKGKVRDYHGPIFWNYGFLPQTWEDPNEKELTWKTAPSSDEVRQHTLVV